MKKRLLLMTLFITILFFPIIFATELNQQPALFIDSNSQECGEDYITVNIEDTISSSNPSCFSEVGCDVKCILKSRYDVTYCGSDFDLIDSNTEECCVGLDAEKTPRIHDVNLISCNSPSGRCDAKCVNPELRESEYLQSVFGILFYTIFIIGYFGWLFTVFILLIIRFWSAYYKEDSFFIKYRKVGIKINLSIFGLTDYSKVKNGRGLLFQVRIGLILFIIAFILVMLFS